MILRYTVELKTRPSFTGTRMPKDIQHAKKIILQLKLQNIREGYCKFSSFKLYDENNKIINYFE